MIPPKGFKAEMFPLRHRLIYAFGLSSVTDGFNGSMCTLVKNYTDSTNVPSNVVVNPHNANFEVDGGAICGPMAIIDRLKMSLKFTLTDHGKQTNKIQATKLTWFPIFFSFPEKLDAADDLTTSTVAAILELTKDATKEDVTPTWTNVDLSATDASELPHPASTSNFTELFSTINLTTNLVHEGVSFDMNTLFKALKYYTNKGALRACMGRLRNFTLTQQFPEKSFFINKFVPRAVRRIVPYSFFAIMIHQPLRAEMGQAYYSAAGTGSKSDVGVKLICTYDEWHPDHHQDMTGDGT